jgi:hypothetical protein
MGDGVRLQEIEFCLLQSFLGGESKQRLQAVYSRMAFEQQNVRSERLSGPPDVLRKHTWCMG